MAKSVWTSKKKLQESNQTKFRKWMDHRCTDLGITKRNIAAQLGCTEKTLSTSYRGEGKWPLKAMAAVLSILEASDEEIVWAVRLFQ